MTQQSYQPVHYTEGEVIEKGQDNEALDLVQTAPPSMAFLVCFQLCKLNSWLRCFSGRWVSVGVPQKGYCIS